MKYFISILLILLGCCLSMAQNVQNLVVNGGFEVLSNGYCVKTANASVSEYSGWFDIGIQGFTANGDLGRTSPDSYNFDTCGTHEAWNNHVPLNYAGYLDFLINSGQKVKRHIYFGLIY